MEPIIPLSTLTKEDVVIVPAFGASKDVVKELVEIGIDPKKIWHNLSFRYEKFGKEAGS